MLQFVHLTSRGPTLTRYHFPQDVLWRFMFCFPKPSARRSGDSLNIAILKCAAQAMSISEACNSDIWYWSHVIAGKCLIWCLEIFGFLTRKNANHTLWIFFLFCCIRLNLSACWKRRQAHQKWQYIYSIKMARRTERTRYSLFWG